MHYQVTEQEYIEIYLGYQKVTSGKPHQDKVSLKSIKKHLRNVSCAIKEVYLDGY